VPRGYFGAEASGHWGAYVAFRHSISTQGAPKPVGPYAQGVVVGNTLYVSGQIGLEPSRGRLVGGGIVAETEQVLENLFAVVHAAGFTRADVVKTTVFVTDLADFATVNGVYERYFAEPYPARATVQVAALPAGARVEIEAVAVRG
jgi:2-iminobutanoate/2-iminopropanoate deaminase